MHPILIIKHEKNEGPGTLEEYLIEKHRQFVIIELWNGDKLPSLDACSAIISLGGPMNVYEEEEYPFLGLEDGFLKGAIEKNIPTMGICLGAQLLAKCMSERVYKADQAEIGWGAIRMTAETRQDPLFRGLPHTMEVFQWHEDTFTIPANGTLLASSNECQNQAMRIGTRAWGLQFHPEMTIQMIEAWSATEGSKINVKKLIDRYLHIKEIYKKHAITIYDNFMGVIDKKGRTN